MRAPYSTPDNRVVPLRPAITADLDAVFEVISARDVADLGRRDFTLRELRDRWKASDFALADDTLVADLGNGRIAAYAEANRHGALIAVAPGHDQDHELGTALLDWTERREHELGHPQFHQFLAAGNTRGREMLERGGYRIVRHLWRMVRPLNHSEDRQPPPLVPAPSTIREPDPDRDAAALHALDELSFAGAADYAAISLSGFIDHHLHAHELDLSLSSVGEREGEIVAFLLARRWDDEHAGFIDLLAVHPAHQRQGLGRALLLTAFARIAAAGLREAQLAVSSENPGGLALYKGVGMTVRFEHDIWERETHD
jgi:ribosomal protein S18 acetylase RimI-like enzyme